MPQSLSNIVIHSVFSTKNRTPTFSNIDFREELHRYLGGVCKSLDCQPLIIGGVADHVHLLTKLSRTFSPADFIKETKRVSNHWIRSQDKQFQQFNWQAGYGSFSVSESNVPEVRAYIQNQEEHHKKMSFKEEFRLFCEKNRIEIDERYVWD